MSKKSLVALAHGLDVQENVTRVFDMMGGAAKRIEPNSTVVHKPTAGHAAPPEFAVCTHPETVRAVIREVKKANPKRIVIAEAAAVGCDTDECYEACGIAAVAREEGVELVDIKKDKDLINVAVRGYRSNISHVKLPRLLEDIFTDDFMQEYTRFESFEGFRYSSAVMVNWKADTLIYAPPLLDAFVKESTDFATWDEMVRSATGLRYRR